MPFDSATITSLHTDVEDPIGGRQTERPHEVVDLLLGALGVGVPVVGLTHVIGKILEPVVARARHSG